MAPQCIDGDQNVGALKGRGIIFIEPFTLTNVQVAAVHLTLCKITADGKRVGLDGNRRFLLKPGCGVNVTTNERVALPLDYVGRLAAPMQLTSIGVVSSLGFKIEPGYDGHLRFYMFNAGATSFRMGAGEPIASLEIMRLGTIPSQIIRR